MKLNTNKPKEKMKSIMQKIRLRYLVRKDIKKFSKNAAFSLFDDSFDQLSARIMYNVHAIEKGMSHVQNFRPGFGSRALSSLNDALVVYENKNYKKNSYPYIQGKSIIVKYMRLHKEMNYDIDFMEEFVSKEFLKEVPSTSTGTKKIYSNDKKNNKKINFLELAKNRSSVREFSGNSIDEEKIINALRIAEKTPSVCNRQGWKVFLVRDKQTIEKLLKFQRGFSGYSYLPEAVLIIGVSSSTFLSPVERNEVFVDGGLFSMSVLYGLEYEGLAAVALNAMMNSKDEDSIRKLINISDEIQLTMFIAVGDLKAETIVPVSDRRSVEDFITIV